MKFTYHWNLLGILIVLTHIQFVHPDSCNFHNEHIDCDCCCMNTIYTLWISYTFLGNCSNQSWDSWVENLPRKKIMFLKSAKLDDCPKLSVGTFAPSPLFIADDFFGRPLSHIMRFQKYFNHAHILIGVSTLQFLKFWCQNGVNILFLVVKPIERHQALF